MPLIPLRARRLCAHTIIHEEPSRERWPVRSLIIFSGTPAANNSNAPVSLRLWLVCVHQEHISTAWSVLQQPLLVYTLRKLQPWWNYHIWKSENSSRVRGLYILAYEYHYIRTLMQVHMAEYTSIGLATNHTNIATNNVLCHIARAIWFYETYIH